MKRWLFGTTIFALVLTLLGAGAFAEYRSRSNPNRAKVRADSDGFSSAVDLKRFRKGNEVWDTQELVASGLKALHQDHVRILRELEALKAGINQLEGKK